MTGREANPPQAAPRFYYGYVIVASAFVVMLLSQGIYMAFGVFFDPLLEEFNWSRAVISGAYSLSSIISGLLGIAMGWFTDRFGPRLVITFCGIFLGLGYLLLALVHSLWQLYLFYGVIVGVGMSGLWVPLLSPVARWFTGRRSLMTGIVISGLTLGQLITPLVVSRLIAVYGWRLSYIILGGAVMLVIVILAQLMRRDPGKAGLGPLAQDAGAKESLKPVSLDFNLRQAFHTSQFWVVVLIFFCVGFAAFSILVHIVPHAIQLGVSPFTAANILAISGGIGIIGNFVLGGLLGDKIGNRKAFIIGTFLMAAALFWLIPARQLWALYLFAVVFGIGLGDMGTSESPLIARLFGMSSHGLIYAVAGLSWTAGGAVGPVITGYLWDVLGNYQMAFLLCAAVGTIGLFLLFLLKPTKKRLEFGL